MSRDDVAFLLFRSHFCARYRLVEMAGYGPLLASWAWRGLSASARAPWIAVAKTAEAQAAEAAEDAGESTRNHLLSFLRVRRLFYDGELRTALDALISLIEAEDAPLDAEEAEE